MRSKGISIHQAPGMAAGVSVCSPPSVIICECGGQPRRWAAAGSGPRLPVPERGPPPSGKCLCVAGPPVLVHRAPMARKGRSRGGDRTATRETWPRACRHKEAEGGGGLPTALSSPGGLSQCLLTMPHTAGSHPQHPGCPWGTLGSDSVLQMRKPSPREHKPWSGPQVWLRPFARGLCPGEATSAPCLSLSSVLCSLFFSLFLSLCLSPLSL